jgi:CDP-diacylglycerol--glycerol-3-phosphate 3-phosphatidyltransferase
MSGKLKMLAQCAAVALSLYALTYGTSPVPQGLDIAVQVAVWTAVGLTVYSGLEYIRRAVNLLRQMAA